MRVSEEEKILSVENVGLSNFTHFYFIQKNSESCFLGLDCSVYANDVGWRGLGGGLGDLPLR